MKGSVIQGESFNQQNTPPEISIQEVSSVNKTHDKSIDQTVVNVSHIENSQNNPVTNSEYNSVPKEPKSGEKNDQIKD